MDGWLESALRLAPECFRPVAGRGQEVCARAVWVVREGQGKGAAKAGRRVSARGASAKCDGAGGARRRARPLVCARARACARRGEGADAGGRKGGGLTGHASARTLQQVGVEGLQHGGLDCRVLVHRGLELLSVPLNPTARLGRHDLGAPGGRAHRGGRAGRSREGRVTGPLTRKPAPPLPPRPPPLPPRPRPRQPRTPDSGTACRGPPGQRAPCRR